MDVEVRPSATESIAHARRAVRAGTQLCTDYGSRSNQELLLFFGFALAGNVHELLPLTVEASCSHCGGDTRKQGLLEELLGEEGPPQVDDFVCARVMCDVSRSI